MLESALPVEALENCHPGFHLSQTGLGGTCLIHNDSVTAVQVVKEDCSGWTILAIFLEFKNKTSLHHKP